MSNAAKNFDILATFYNYFDRSTLLITFLICI